MKELIEGFSKQLIDALNIGLDAKLSQNTAEIRNVIVCGMGGSGIGGNIVASLNKESLKVPLEVLKSYKIPNYVNRNTLFIASSFSGDTEETLNCLNQAITREAEVCVVTSGGRILDLAKKMNLDKIVIPHSNDYPRINVGFSFINLLFILNSFGLIADEFIEQTKAGANLIEKERVKILLRAQEIANSLKGKFPVIYSDDTFYPIALRFQQQINENSKQLAHVNVFSEMNHNELVGWSSPSLDFTKMSLVYLTSDDSYPAIIKRMEICKDIFREKCDHIEEVKSMGNSRLEKFIFLIHLADWVSYFLAVENNIDPLPVEKIDYLKSALASDI